MTDRMTAAELVAMQGKGSRKNQEDPIHKAILELLILVLPRGTPINHSPNELNLGGDKKAKAIAQARAKALGMTPGWPDLEFMVDGRAYFLEVKTAEGKTHKEQRDCIACLIAAGCKVQVVRNVDGARRALQEWGFM